jgi:hypothetical protein
MLGDALGQVSSIDRAIKILAWQAAVITLVIGWVGDGCKSLMLLTALSVIYENSFKLDFFFAYRALNSGSHTYKAGTLPLEPLHQPFIVKGFFQDRVLKTICLGWLWTSILLISASRVGWITGVSTGDQLKLYSYVILWAVSSIPVQKHTFLLYLRGRFTQLARKESGKWAESWCLQTPDAFVSCMVAPNLTKGFISVFQFSCTIDYWQILT